MMRISAKHQSAPTAEKVQMSAAPYRGAPIRTCPALDDLVDDLMTDDPVHSRWRVKLDGDHWHLIAVWPALTRQQVIDAWHALDAEPDG